MSSRILTTIPCWLKSFPIRVMAHDDGDWSVVAQDVREQVLAIIAHHGQKGILTSRLYTESWGYRQLLPQEKRALLAALLEEGVITQVNPSSTGKAGAGRYRVRRVQKVGAPHA